MKQVTLVALYGKKPDHLAKLITECQELITEGTHDRPAVSFNPYSLDQVHATVIGLETTESGPLVNRNFLKWRDRSEAMDHSALLSHLRKSDTAPFQIQLGGFEYGTAPMSSRGESPYERSFSIQDEKAVLMGWPIEATQSKSSHYPDTLESLRRQCQEFGILHGHHRKSKDVDNDFYLRLGTFSDSNEDPHFVKEITSAIQRHLSVRAPLFVEVSLEDLFMVSYVDEALPRGSSKAWSLTDRRVDGDFIQKLYEGSSDHQAEAK